MSWLDDFRAPLDASLNEPLPDDLRASIEEMQKRLEQASRYDPTVNAVLTMRQYTLRQGEFWMTREMTYAALAYQLLKAKLHWEKLAMDLSATIPTTRVLLTPSGKVPT